MKKLLILFFLSVALIGCTTTAILPSAPEISSLTKYESADLVVVGQIMDGRTNESSGSIGGFSVRISNDLGPLAIHHLAHILNDGLKLNVRYDPDFNEYNYKRQLLKSSGDRFVLGTVREVSVYAGDSLLQSVESFALVNIKLFNRNGRQLFEKNVKGKSSKYFGLTKGAKEVGLLVEETLKSAFQNLVEDEEFRNAFK